MHPHDRVGRLLATSNEKRRFKLIADFVTSEPTTAASEGERLLAVADPQARTLGADLLGQVVCVVRPDVGRIVDTLLPRLNEETDAEALSSVIVALGHAQDDRATTPVIAFADHENASVRLAVAWALPMQGFDDPAVATLRRLSADPDDDVRDWATFGLAESGAADEATIEALIARSDDPHYDTRCEAILGLARLHHPRARELVDRQLACPMVGTLIEEARDILAEDGATAISHRRGSPRRKTGRLSQP